MWFLPHLQASRHPRGRFRRGAFLQPLDYRLFDATVDLLAAAHSASGDDPSSQAVAPTQLRRHVAAASQEFGPEPVLGGRLFFPFVQGGQAAPFQALLERVQFSEPCDVAWPRPTLPSADPGSPRGAAGRPVSGRRAPGRGVTNVGRTRGARRQRLHLPRSPPADLLETRRPGEVPKG